MPLYLGESEGSRILLYGNGINQVGDDYQASFETWDLIPMGEMGDCIFRSIGLSFSYTNGYHLGITPVVDGVAQTESYFTASGSSTNGQAQVPIKKRGTRIAVRVRTLSRQGDVSFQNISVSWGGLRQWP